MRKVLIVKNINREGPGLLADVLRAANIAAGGALHTDESKIL